MVPSNLFSRFCRKYPMVTVRKATIDLFDRIYPLLEYFHVEGMDRAGWFCLLSKQWFAEHDHFGYVLFDGEEVVGFLGVFFYQRRIDAALYSICSFFCWHVLPPYRKYSLLLVRPVLSRKELTITSLTPSPEAVPVWERFGFRELENRVRVFPLLPVPFMCKGIDFIDDAQKIPHLLTREHRNYFFDHELPLCRHLLLVERKSNRYCYLVYNRVRKKGLHFTQLCFISDPEIFSAAFPALRWYFFRTCRTLLTIVDSRLVGRIAVGPCWDYQLRYPRLYRSDDLAPEQIDNLYAEQLLLGSV